VLETLAADELDGRDNLTPGSVRAQAIIVEQLTRFAEPADPGVADLQAYLQRFGAGTNVIGVIPGTDLADEYVMIGAHYDHLGLGECNPVDRAGTDDVCNGATDNATGVVAALAVAEVIAAAAPRRSVIVALWDAEEDGLVGSRAYVADPVVPLEQTVAYVNFDIQGSDLLPSLAGSTIVIGAETGGQLLIEATTSAVADSTLDTSVFSRVFGQDRSDHAPLIGAGVPSVFFTDATNGCYHTVGDDIDIVNFDKLEEQVATATALVDHLVTSDTPPRLDPAAPLSSYGDAVALLALVERAEPDLPLLRPQAAADVAAIIVALRSVVDAGPAAYDDDAQSVVLGGGAELIQLLAASGCQSA
jgi:hypothetical protein